MAKTGSGLTTVARRLLDTNILIYAVRPEPGEERKRSIALELLRAEGVVVSVQVLQEFYAQATRLSHPNRLSHDDAMQFLDALPTEAVQELTVVVFRRATALCRRYQISYWDAAIIAAAQMAGCDAVYSEDLNAEQNYDGMPVINPFAI